MTMKLKGDREVKEDKSLCVKVNHLPDSQRLSGVDVQAASLGTSFLPSSMVSTGLLPMFLYPL